MQRRLLAALGLRSWSALRGASGAKAPAQHRQAASKDAKERAEEVAEEAVEEGGSFARDFLRSKLGFVLTGASALLLVNLAASAGSNYYYKRQVLSTLERGVVPESRRRGVLERAALRQVLQEMLAQPTRFFHIVAGPPGSGKSTLLREAVADAGGGVGYVDVSPAVLDFGADLGAALGFRYEEHMGLFNVVSTAVLGQKVRDRGQEHPLASLRRAAEALRSAALEYKDRSGRPFVLVIDSADRLLKDEAGRQALSALLEYSRDWAGEGLVTVVWVAHSWRTMETIAGAHSTRSRASPPLIIADITEEEGMRYLSMMGVEGAAARSCLSLVGGSLLLLERAAGMVARGEDMTEVRSRLLDLQELAFAQAGLLDASVQQDPGLRVVEALLCAPEQAIGAAEWRLHVPDPGQQHALLESGVFRFDGRTLSFGSRLAAVYARERLKGRLSPAEQQRHRSLGGGGGGKGGGGWLRGWASHAVDA